MKRKLLHTSLVSLFLALCMVGNLSAQSSKGFHWNKPQPTPFVHAVQPKAHALLAASNKAPAETVLQEDFSKWTAGTEAVPDGKPVCGSHTSFTIPAKYTKMKGWVGNEAYQAGGICCLRMFENGERAGFVSTPEMELFGDVVLTFRARRLNAKDTEGTLWVALCDNNTGPEDNFTLQLTTEWQNFEIKTSKGTFNANNLFQFQAEKCDMLLDDIKIVRTKTKILAPSVLNPVNLSSTSFVARWKSTKDAKSYLLNVYYKGMPDEVIPETTVMENFDAISFDETTRKINLTTPNYPQGWAIDVSSKGKKDVCTDAADLHSGKLSLNFDEEGDYIMTPASPAPITKVSFWVKPSSMEAEPNFSYSMVGVSALMGGNWTPIAYIPNSWMQKDGGFYTLDQNALGDNATQIKIEYIQKNLLSFAIDDVTYTYKTLPIPKPFITDKEVTDTFCVVSGIHPEYEYFYSVKAKDGDVLSDPSNDVWVDGIVGVTPMPKEPTNVSATSYTANWEALYHADKYQLNTYQIVQPKEETSDVVVLHETFDRINEGSVEQPSVTYDRTASLAQRGETDTDWMQQLPAWAKGMAGTQETNYYLGLAGLVVSPRLSLDCNSGIFEVDLKAYNTHPGDTLFVLVMKEYSDRVALDARVLPMGATPGYTSGTVSFDNLVTDWNQRRNVKLAFMSMYGKPFYLDEVTVRQTVKAGEKLYRPTKTFFTDKCSYEVRDLEPNHDYAYSVIALAKKYSDSYVSNASDLKDVYNATTVVQPVEDSMLRIIPSEGRIDVYAATAVDVHVYDMRGCLVGKASSASSSHHSFSLLPGLYVVKVNDIAEKVVVR